MNSSQLQLLAELVRREVRTRYLDSFSGLAWLLIQPLFLLAIYAFVFTKIFQARIPEADLTGFVPYLAVAFWPWTAFSEAVLRASESILENSGLIGKIALPTWLFPAAAVISTFGMHMVGYLAVLLVLSLTGTDIHWLGLLPAVPVLLLVLVMALALGLALSAMTVFVRDLRHALPSLMTLWFFSTPILYSVSLIPERYHALMSLNPFSPVVEAMRVLLLGGDWHSLLGAWWLLPASLVLLGVACFVFRRLSPRFEDFF